MGAVGGRKVDRDDVTLLVDAEWRAQFLICGRCPAAPELTSLEISSFLFSLRYFEIDRTPIDIHADLPVARELQLELEFLLQAINGIYSNTGLWGDLEIDGGRPFLECLLIFYARDLD